VQTAGGIQKLNCANTEGIFRVIQSIPSAKAEPFKLWLIGVDRRIIKENYKLRIMNCKKKEIRTASARPMAIGTTLRLKHLSAGVRKSGGFREKNASHGLAFIC